jgi:hypothetical protein
VRQIALSCLWVLAVVGLLSPWAEATAKFRTSAAGGGTSGTVDRTVTITPAVGDLFVVFCVASVNTQTAPTMTDDNSGTYSLITTAQKATSADTMSVFVRNQFLVNTTSTVITCTTGSNTAGEIVAVAVTGMTRTGSSAVRQSNRQQNQAAAGTPAPVFTSTTLTDNMTLGAIFNATNPATMTTPTNWTERQDVGQATPTTGLEVVTRDSGFAGTTVTWGSTSGSAFSSIIVELDASVGPTASVTVSPSPGTPSAGRKAAPSASVAFSTSVTGLGPQQKQALVSVGLTVNPGVCLNCSTPLAQAVHVTPVAAESAALHASVSAAVAVSPAVVATKTKLVGVSASVSVSPAVVQHSAQHGNPTASVTISPTVVATKAKVATPSVSISVSPVVVRAGQLHSTASASVAVSPSVTVTRGALASVQASVGVSPGVCLNCSTPLSAAVHVVPSVQRSAGRQGPVAASVHLDLGLQRLAVLHTVPTASVSFSATATGTKSGSGGSVTRNVAQSLSVKPDLCLGCGTPLSASLSITATATATRIGAQQRTGAVSLTCNPLVQVCQTENFTGTRVFVSPVATVSRATVGSGAIALHVSPVVTAKAADKAQPAIVLSVSPTVTARMVATRLLAQGLHISSNGTSSSPFNKSLSTFLVVSPVAVPTRQLHVGVATSFQIAAAASGSRGQTARVSQSLAIAVTGVRGLQATVARSQSLNVATSVTALSVHQAQPSLGFVILPAVIRSVVRKVAISQLLQVTPQGQGGRTSHDKFASVVAALHVNIQAVNGGSLGIAKAVSINVGTNVIVIQSNRRRAVLVISH